MAEEGIQVSYQGKIAIITLNQPMKLNALNQDQYYRLATAMHEVAARDDIYITVLTGNGRYFSAYVLYLSFFNTCPSPPSSRPATYNRLSQANTNHNPEEPTSPSAANNPPPPKTCAASG
jgi:hypothetical protein